MTYRYEHLVIGGTFDRLHLGHENFILHAFQLAETVTIGITSDLFIKNKSENQQIISLEKRKQAIVNFLTSQKIINRYRFSTLNDIFGITKTEQNIDAILVTQETKHNAVIINKFRKKSRLPELKIEIMLLIKSEDRKIIRSQRIRFGEIDRNGKIYRRMFIKKLNLPIKLRESLRKPIGKVVNSQQLAVSNWQSAVGSFQSFDLSQNNHPLIISVGDIISFKLEKNNIIPAVKIIDLRSRRKPIYQNMIDYIFTTKKIINPPGFIYPRAVQTIHNAIVQYSKIKQPQTIVIKGEEDLLTLPTILLAPLGALVIYGQKDVGAVVVEVTEEIKQKITALIMKFKIVA